MTTQRIIHTGTLRSLHVGQPVKACGIQGVIVEIRDNCKFPIFVKFPDKVDAFLWSEID